MNKVSEFEMKAGSVTWCFLLPWAPAWLVSSQFPIRREDRSPVGSWARRQTQEPQTMSFSESCLLLGAYGFCMRSVAMWLDAHSSGMSFLPASTSDLQEIQLRVGFVSCVPDTITVCVPFITIGLHFLCAKQAIIQRILPTALASGNNDYLPSACGKAKDHRGKLPITLLFASSRAWIGIYVHLILAFELLPSPQPHISL